MGDINIGNRFLAACLTIVLLLGMTPASNALYIRAEGQEQVEDLVTDGNDPIEEAPEIIVLTGTVTDEQDSILSGVRITASSSEFGELETETDDNGEYQLYLERGAVYNISFSKPEYKSEAIDGYLADSPDNQLNIKLTSKGYDEDFRFVLPDTSNITYKKDLRIDFKAECSTNDLDISYSIDWDKSDPGVATINEADRVLIIHKAGRVTIKASRQECENYKESTILYTLTIDKAERANFRFEQVGTEADPIKVKITDGSYTNKAIDDLGSSGVSYKIVEGYEHANVNNNGRVNLNSVGTIKVKATISEDDCYKKAETYYYLNIVLDLQDHFYFEGPSEHTITFSEMESFFKAATGGSGRGDITYEIVEEDPNEVGDPVATIEDSSEGVLTILNAGRVRVRATKAADSDYESATAEYTLIIKRAKQAWFGFGHPTEEYITYNENNNTFKKEAIGGSGTGEISYEIIEGDAAKIEDESEGVLTILNAGRVRVRATKAADSNYESATAEYTLTINKAEQPYFGFEEPLDEHITYNQNDNIFIKKASGGSGSGDISYSIVWQYPNDAATIKDEASGELVINRAGKVKIKATKEEDECYQKAQATYEITIERAEQKIKFELADPTEIYLGSDFTNRAVEVADIDSPDKLGYGEGDISYSIVGEGNGIAHVDSNGKIGYKNNGVGQITVRAVKEACSRYNEAETEYILDIVYLQAPDIPYEITGETKNDSGWYTGNITVSAPEGYHISRDFTDSQGWVESIIVSEEGRNELSIYLRSKDNKGITDAILIDKDKLMIDKTPPSSLSIDYSVGFIEKILEYISKNYKAAVTVTLSAEDDISTIQAFEYSYTSLDGDVEYEIADISEMTVEDSTVYYSFKIDSEFKGRVSFKAIDVAGNEIMKYGDEVIVVDTIAPKANISYSGPLSQMVDRNNVTVTYPDGDGDTRFIYNGDIQAVIEITETNFYPEDVMIEVKRDGEVVDDFVYGGWEKAEDKDETYIQTIMLSQDGDYEISMEYQDSSGNEFEWESGEFADKSGSKVYTSNILAIDKTKPVISLSFDNNTAKSYQGYFDADRIATITIKDRNFRPDELNFTVTAEDIENKELDFDLSQKITSWREVSTYVWEADLLFDMDANYTFNIEYIDMAGNAADVLTADDFTIDKTGPRNLAITYSDSHSIWEDILNAITFGYYKPSVEVTITAEDITSGVDYFTWTYTQEDATSTVNKARQTGKIKADKISYSNNGKTAVASFVLTADQAAQYRGNITITATDKAGNTSASVRDDGRIIVVDTIAPTRTVEYTPAKQVLNKATMKTRNSYSYTAEGTNSILYYDGPMTVTFRVNEANFYKEDFIVRVNGQKRKLTNWSKRAGSDQWTGSISLSSDGDYIVTAEYSDRSNNKMKSYTSEQITIDTVKPVIDVKYSPASRVRSVGGRSYYDKRQTAVITITEKNFRADDVLVEVTATDAGGNKVNVSNYTAYLKNKNNWTKKGNKYTATISYSVDANYTFDISYKDLALNQAKAYAKDEFTIDTKAPQALSVSYSRSILDTVLGGVTFGYYNAPITVTIRGEDTTSGIHGFRYSYKNSSGVSSVNAQLIDKALAASVINYSEDGKTASATFRIPESVLRANNQFNGRLEFTAVDRSGNSTDLVSNRRLVVDNIAPTANVSYNTPVQKIDDISYYSGAIDAKITINEANFFSDDVKVMVSKDGASPYQVTPSWTDESADIHTGRLTIEGDGSYLVTINYTDKSLNKMTEYVSNKLIIDTTKPSISINGIEHESANREDIVGFVVTVEDKNLERASFAPTLTGTIRNEDGNFETIDFTQKGTIETIVSGQKYTYTVSNLELDGIYTLTCGVTDIAKNVCNDLEIIDSDVISKELVFSINRKGSSYSVDDTVSTMFGRFVNESSDVVISEINADILAGLKVTLFKNNQTITLEEGRDYKIDLTRGSGGWYEYTYTIFNNNFKDDGVYRLALQTEDAAGNVSQNTLETKDMEISFGVDKTSPNIVVTNLESGVTYPLESLTALMSVSDNLKLENVVVYLNGDQYKSWSGEDIEQMIKEKADFTFDISGDSLRPHSVKIVATDAAGNESIIELIDFYITTNLWVRYYNNKYLFFGSIAGALLMAVGIIVLVLYRKKKLANTSA